MEAVLAQVRDVVHSFFVVDSIWSIVFRAAIWFIIALFIIIGTDVADPERSASKMKANLGFLLLFLVLSTGLIYLLFGYTAVPTQAAGV